MAITGITTTADNGVNRITNAQTITGTGTADGVTLVLDNAASFLEVTGTGSVVVINSHVKLDADVGTGNDATSPINFGGRTITTSEMAFRNSIILCGPFTARRNIQVTEITDTEVIEADQSGFMFCYTGTDAIINRVRFSGINTWEIYAPPSVFFDTIVEDCNYGYLNWEAGRVDVFGFQVINAGIAEIWIGSGNSGNNQSYHWNNHSTFDNTNVRHESVNNEYFSGYTASWKFVDTLNSDAAVQDVKLLFRESRDGGAQSLLATYLTNSSGVLVGTYDSQFRTTGSSIVRATLFMQTVYSDTAGTTYQGGAQNETYDLLNVVPAIEVRAYGYLAPTGFLNTDTFVPTAEIGLVGSDGNVITYANFGLLTDTGINDTKTNADAYIAINDMDKLYNRTKAEWYDNNDYPLPTKDGVKLNPGCTSLIVDGDTVTPWSYASGPDAITIGTLSGVTIDFVGSTEAVSSGESDQITISFPTMQVDDVAYLAVGHSQSGENVWNTPAGWVIPTGLTEVQTGGTPASHPGVSVFRRVITGSEGASVTVTNVGTNTSGIVAQMMVYRNVDTTTPEEATPTTATGTTGDPDPASITTTNNASRILVIGFMDDGDQTDPTAPSGYTLRQATATLDGAGTGE